MLGFPGVGEALLLIALGVGFMVLYFAKREEKGLQFTGYVIGIGIIALALFYIVGNILLQAQICYPKMRYYKGMMQQRMMQPRTIPQAPAQRP